MRMVLGVAAAAVACLSACDCSRHEITDGGATGGGTAMGEGGGTAAGGGATGGGVATGGGGAATGGGGAATGGGGAATCPTQVPSCLGVCASTPPFCDGGVWQCTGPGYQSPETLCDGYDNDCDGVADESCPACTPDIARVQQNLISIWDIDFDAQCNTFLTTNISGPDHVTVVPVDGGGPVAQYVGNANQNMVYALVDKDPRHPRTVVTYSCCTACNCQATNGLTLMYTCDAGTPGCGCAGNTNCPGFLDAPFLASLPEDTHHTANAITLTTPTGLAAGPGSHYFVGNWRPLTCLADAGCTACDPSSPATTCSPTRVACCDTTALGRLAEFTLPEGTTEPTFRIAAVYANEEILNLASTSSGEVLVATATASGGALHRYNPATHSSQTVNTFSAPVYSAAEDPRHGDYYVELLSGSNRLLRLATDGGTLALPNGVPAQVSDNAVLQFGPEHSLYRLSGVGSGASALGVYPIP